MKTKALILTALTLLSIVEKAEANDGAAIAAGIVGGVVIGALVAGVTSPNGGYYNGSGYYNGGYYGGQSYYSPPEGCNYMYGCGGGYTRPYYAPRPYRGW